VVDTGNGQIYGPKQQRDLVVIGASAGGVDALQALVRNLPAEFPAAILVVLHVASTGTSVLPQILSRQGPLPAVFARDRDELRRGQIFVAPADHHMLIHDGRIRLTRGPRENGHRPAVDPLFRSAGRAAGRRTIAVVLSGLLDDGASGLRFIKASGGAAVVQDPEDALFPSMPKAAMALAHVDRIVPAYSMGDVLCALIEESIEVGHDEEESDSDPAGVPPVDSGTEGADRVELEDPVDTAAAHSGSRSMAPTCASPATSATRTRSRAWSRSRGDPSRRPSGQPSVRSRNGRICTDGWRAAPADRGASSTRLGRRTPKDTRSSCASS
jgi:hypothetical protein